MFHGLAREHIAEIVEIQVGLLRGRLADRELNLQLSDAAIDWIADAGFDPAYGARPLKRVLQKQVADQIAVGILKGTYKPGDTISVDAHRETGLTFETIVDAVTVN